VAGILDIQFVSVSITTQGSHLYRNGRYELRRTNTEICLISVCLVYKNSVTHLEAQLTC
jgi:hypothetical protein